MRNQTSHCFLFLAALVVSSASHAQTKPAIAIEHVTVVDVATGDKLPDRTVIVQGDRILSIDPSSANITLPEGGQRIDAHGGFLIPGLWDMHVHIHDTEDLPLYLANGVVGVRLMFGAKDTNDLRAKLSAVPFAPQVIYGSPIVDGDPPVWPNSIVVRKPEDARRVVDEIKSSGADFVKIYNGLTRDVYLAIADESKKQGIPFAGHLPHEVRASEASEAGQRSIEHLDGILIACSQHEQELMRQLRPLRFLENINTMAEASRSFDPARCQALFAEFRRNQTWQVPTLTVHRGIAYMNDSHFTSDPRLAYMSTVTRQRWHPENDHRFRRWRSSEFDQQRSVLRVDQQLVSMMFRAGVPLLAGTDAMNPFCFPGFSLHDELALLVESGVTPLAALQMATLRPAEFLGHSAESGSIAPGKRADLVLLSGDPLADIHNTTKIQAVWFAGNYLDRAALDAMLERAKHRSGKGKLN